ncbi:DEAD/DEAH box helicase [Desulfobaculum bizertense]|uniref:Superfamily II DNA or RNA helicase, SNF2 family n=1 Tax=Desulfobaculum bizertense DSM 18034 TaxID=1121442 RepID=A0A1T4W7Q4_9BACT|nr:SNF2-related protein [Desulfobaculum bizertense]UIJ39155.1 DEAD/DEAH box helicase [Desulfobaculum bizertense]SKA73300.1 Superfamily II DNA or RNA helicase, SNF2 family [Desulfobaculum bizertense DSM 18034]
MDNADEKIVENLLQEFINFTVPDYILDGARQIVSNNGVQKLSLNKREGYWDVEGQIEGEDFQAYSSELGLNLSEGTVNFYCNCPDSFSGVCKHVGATALKLYQTFEVKEEGTAPQQSSDWRQCFRSYFATEPEPEAGKHYLIFRFFPEPGRLQVAFYRARQNKSGLSTVQNEVTLEQIINNDDWCEVSPRLPQVAEQISRYLDYAGHRVDIPEGLISWFFWAIQDEYYIFREDSEQIIRIEPRTMRLKLSPVISEDGVAFDVLLDHEGKIPFSIRDEQVYFYGQLPIWAYYKQTFYPVQTGLSPELIRDMTQSSPVIQNNDISEFLDRVWTKLPSSDVHGQDEFIEKMSPFFIPAEYAPKLFLDEEGSLLTLRIHNAYETEHGEAALPGPDPDLQTGSYSYEGKSYLILRQQQKEAELTATLLEMGFQPRDTDTWFLEPEEAISFLLDNYPALVEKYRVYGEKNLTRYKVRLSTPNIVAEVKSDEQEEENNSWFTLDLNVEYDGHRVPIDIIWEAWTSGKRYVQLKDGSYTSLPEKWLEKLGHKLKTMGFDPEKPPQKEFKQYEAPVLDKILEDLPDAVTDGFWDNLKEKIHSFEQITPVNQPETLNATLRPYQVQGVSFLNFLNEYGFGGILADEMGLGKTIQTLSFLLHLTENGATKPSLIVVPTSVLPNWEREAEKFVPQLKRLTIYGARRDHLFKKIPKAQLVFTTYALLRRDLEELKNYEFTSLILDEAQNIKNPNTITSRAVRMIDSDLRICLSGTPIENNLFELWSLFEFLMPGFLGSQHSFQRGIIKPIKDGDEETLDYLRTRVKPFILRRTKSAVAKDLPPKIESVQYCALAEEQMELYSMLAKKLRDQVLADVDEKGMAKSQMSILDALLKLRQICCHPRLLKLDIPGVSTNLPSGKFDAFKNMVSDIIEEGHKVLVFSQFVSMLHIIRSWLQINETPFCYLDGSSKDRFDQVDRFNNTPEIPIFLISLKAGGTGLNLTSADYVIHYDPWWNPAVEAQATDRTHRIGQTRQVFSYKMICSGTVEEKILTLQQEKKGIADAIIPGKDSFKNLTRDDLEMLFEI